MGRRCLRVKIDYSKEDFEERKLRAERVYREGEYVVCLECGELKRRLDKSHLAKHNLTVLSYREKHSILARVSSKSYVKKQSECSRQIWKNKTLDEKNTWRTHKKAGQNKLGVQDKKAVSIRKTVQERRGTERQKEVREIFIEINNRKDKIEKQVSSFKLTLAREGEDGKFFESLRRIAKIPGFQKKRGRSLSIACVNRSVKDQKRVSSNNSRAQQRRLEDGTHNFYKKMPWGVENVKYELLFDEECRKRELNTLDASQGWDCPPVLTYFGGDFFTFEDRRTNRFRPDRVNRRSRIWIEIDDDNHRYTRAYDFARDEFCRKHGWAVARIFWKRLYNSDYMDRAVARICKAMSDCESLRVAC